MAGAGYEDALTEEGTALEPVNVVMEGSNLADDSEEGRAEAGFHDGVRDVLQGGGDASLLSGRAPLDADGGGARVAAAADESPGDSRQSGAAHEHDDRVDSGGELVPIDGGVFL